MVDDTHYIKDPSAVLDYLFSWATWLAQGETISTHTVTPDPGINLDSHPATGTGVTCWLSGGTSGQRYEVHCHVTTSQGRQDTRTLTVDVQPR